MSQETLLERVLCLPAIEIAAMVRGQLIVAMPRVQIPPNLPFLLAPMWCDDAIDQQYRSPFIALAQTTQHQKTNSETKIEAWAICQRTQMIHDVEKLSALSSLTVWTKSYLENLLQERQHLFLSYLKVYRLPNWLIVPDETIPADKLGKFLGLPALGHEPLKVKNPLVILEESTFEKRKKQLEELRSINYPELETLHSQISEILVTNPAAKLLEKDLTDFLGWASTHDTTPNTPELEWIDRIATVGNSSDGNSFEKMVRKSLIQLGFSNSLNNSRASLDPDSSGGAGGIDVYCDAPFSLVGECKATKHETVPNSVSAQLIHLGHTHLGKPTFDRSVKIIFAAGELTSHAKQAAAENQMNVMRPETLQRLVTLKIKHPGSIDLQQLKVCLETQPFGQDSDDKVNQFIDSIYQTLKIRAHIIQVIKNYLDSDIAINTQAKQVDSTLVYGLYLGSNPPIALTPNQLQEILIELASPLSGYLGRVPGTDRFYFLRELSIA